FHWGDLNTKEYKDEGGETTISNASSQYHIYKLIWDSKSLKTYVDDTLVHEFINASNKPFNAAHYLLLNIAMGGNLGGDIPADFSEGTFEIDYVRIYQYGFHNTIPTENWTLSSAYTLFIDSENEIIKINFIYRGTKLRV